MGEYREDLKRHVEKLFKKTQEIIAKRRGEVNRAQHKNFLSYFDQYNSESVENRKKKKKKRGNDWQDAFAAKPLNRGFRNKKKTPREPTVEQLEQMIEFFERELEKLDGPTPCDIMVKLIYQQQWEAMYHQNPIVTAVQGHKGKTHGTFGPFHVAKNRDSSQNQGKTIVP
jgi:hypothetical protein